MTVKVQKVERERSVAPRIILTVLKWALLLFLTVMALIPFVWMISASLKTSVDVFSIPMKWIPETAHWENFVSIWERVPLLAYFKNTAVLAVIVTIMQIITSSFAAYAFAKMRFKGRDVLFMCYIGTIAVPWQVYMVPQFIMMRSLGLYDTIWALVVLQSFSAFGVFLMRQFYLGIPNELSEAARIDGLNEYGIWARIMPAAGQARHRHTVHLHIRQHMERLHGPDDLPDDRREKNHSGGPTPLHSGIFR